MIARANSDLPPQARLSTTPRRQPPAISQSARPPGSGKVGQFKLQTGMLANSDTDRS